MAFSSLSLEWLPTLPTLVVFLLPIVSLFLLMKRKNGIAGAKLPPSPPKLPFIGNLHQLGKYPHSALWKLSEKYGPLMQFQLGSIPSIVVSSAEMAKEILKTHDLECCSRPPSPGPKKLTYNFLDVAFAPYSDYWREMRKVFVYELLSAKRVNTFWHIREAEVFRLMTSISQLPPKTSVNITEKIFTLVDGIVGEVAFGKSYGGKQFEGQSFQSVLDAIMDVMHSFAAEDFFPSVGPFIDRLTGHQASMSKCFKNLDGYFEMVLRDHVDPNRPKPKHEDLVDVLLSLAKERSGSGFALSKDHIKAILLDTFIGAIDTSSVTMVWAMAEMARNQRILKKAQEEVRSVIGKKTQLAGDDMLKLKYIKMIVKETLRLHAPAPLLIPHQTTKHIKIDGYDVFPDTRVLINVWAIGRNPESWKNPLEFYPERFEGNDIDYKGNHFELLPFGAGRRICPGLTMGSLTVEFVIANLLYWFDWEPPSGMTWEDISMDEGGGLTIHKKEPLRLVPTSHKW